MKYLMLDTNIYLDMVVSRNKAHKSDSYEYMQRLLDYKEIKLLVPAVVVTEIKRHLNSEIEKVHNNLKKINREINNLYWINKIEELETFNTSIKEIKEVVTDLLASFTLDNYISDAHKLFDDLFKHENVLILEETLNVLNGANKRKLHKKKPYHYNDEEKDSFADAVIIETLLNLEDYKELINIEDSDTFYFVSRNKKDFSDEEDENLLHLDLMESLKLNSLKNKFNYRIHFTKTLLQDFKEEIKNAGLTEELENLWEEELLEEFHTEEISRNREAGGLPSLTMDWYEIISEDSEIYAMVSFFINLKEELEYNFISYTEEFYEVKNLLETIKEEEIRDEYVGQFTEEISINPEDFPNEEMWKCDDYFHYSGNILEFRDFDNKLFSVFVEGTLTPQDGEIDTILIKVNSDKFDDKSIWGEIEVTYGYLNFDENLQAADGLQDSINFSLENVYEAVENEQNFILQQIEDAKEILENFILEHNLNL